MFERKQRARKKRPNKSKKLEPVYIRYLADDCNLYHKEIGDLCGVSEATISTALRNNTVYFPIEKAAELAWRKHTGVNTAGLHRMMPDADEISLSYFKSNGHWSMWASRSILVDKEDGQRIKETSIFAREDGESPLHCIQKHLAKKG